MSGQSDGNIRFDDLWKILVQLGFEERVRGSHHVFTRRDVYEIIVLQNVSGKAKIYQVKQVRNLIIKYRLLP